MLNFFTFSCPPSFWFPLAFSAWICQAGFHPGTRKLRCEIHSPQLNEWMNVGEWMNNGEVINVGKWINVSE